MSDISIPTPPPAMRPERFRQCTALLRMTHRELAFHMDLDDRLVRRMAAGEVPIFPDLARWLELGARILEDRGRTAP